MCCVRWWGYIAAAIFVALGSSATALTLAPAVDFQTQGNSSSPTGGQSGTSTLNFRFINSPRADNRFGMEFALASVPTAQVLAGVTWRGTPTTVTGSSLLEFHGYIGNGLFSTSDTYNNINQLGEIVGVTAGGERSVEFDPGYLSTLIGSATHFGMYTRERNDGAFGTFASRSTATPPRLDLVLIDPLAANSNRWQASGTQSWNDPANWNHGIPIASDDVFIRTASATTVMSPASPPTVHSLTLGGGGAPAELVQQGSFASTGLTTLASGGVLHLGNGTYQTGGLNAAPGGTIDWGANGVLALTGGYLSTPFGDFIVDGSGNPILLFVGAKMRKLNTATGVVERLVIGNTANGNLFVGSQSDVRVANLSVGSQSTAHGTATVSDSGTLLLIGGLLEVGPNGNGEVFVHQQARLEAGAVFVGSNIQGVYDPNTVDLFTITDPGTTAKLGSLNANGKSIVEIRNGAVVQTSGVGGAGDTFQPPVLRVTGAGSQIIVTDRVQTGSNQLANGSSKMFVEAGGRIDTKLFILGIASATTGVSHSEFTITGPGSQVNTTSTVIFGGIHDAEASLDILDGGVFRAGAQSLMSSTSGTVANAKVSGVGSRWEQTGELHVGGGRDLNSQLIDLGPANLDIESGGAVVATGAVNIMKKGKLNLKDGRLQSPLIRHDRGGEFNFTGGTLVVDQFVGNIDQHGGTLAAGASPGTTVITGNYTQDPSGNLEVEIAGIGAPGVAYDHYDVTGVATLRGTLDVRLLGGFVPSVGDSFAFLTGHAGFDVMFAGMQLPSLPAGRTWRLNPGDITVFLNVVASVPGDYNNNGIVDAGDYVVWRKTLGQIGTALAADGNANNQIDPGDYDVWRSHFGQSAGSGFGASSHAAVPEPASAVLLIFAAAVRYLPRCPAARKVPTTH